MGGANFDKPNINSPEWNIVQDIEAAKVTFEHWPTKIVASGGEIGEKLLFPHQSITNDLPNSHNHPMVVSYRVFKKMPYDRPSWDLTAVQYAVCQYKTGFSLSEPGIIRIENSGKSTFEASENGKHYYLCMVNQQIPHILNELVHSVIGKIK